MKTLAYFLKSVVIAALLFSCGDDYFEKKPDKSIVVPSTLTDLQALLDNTQVMNISPALNVVSADEMFITAEGLLDHTAIERNSYTWADDLYYGELQCVDWNVPYKAVFHANVVLDALDNINIIPMNEQTWNSLKGSALFHRAFAFYQLAQLFAPGYDGDGIPLRLTADVNAPVTRASVEETYNQIIRDLKLAVDLLPFVVSVKTRPSKGAALAMLARVYLTREDYTNAEAYASLALEQNHVLLDYNTLDPLALRPVPAMNAETIFYSSMITYGILSVPTTFVDTTLFALYENNDLRKSIFFRQRAANRYTFKGNYTGLVTLFGGLATDELFLIRAEARVRNGNVPGALEDLNMLLVKRWRTGTFLPVTEANAEALLALILTERRKEMVYRGTRWTDLRRLNKDDRFKTTLNRNIGGTTYSLPPDDSRYTFPIPPQEIAASGIKQNPR